MKPSLTGAALTVVALGVLASVSAAGLPVTDQPMLLFYGTTHAHTATDNDHGSSEDPRPDAAAVIAAARDEGFDFFFLTEHSGPSGPADPAEFWRSSRASAREQSVDGTFAAFSGYEYSDNYGDGGHLTVVGTSEWIEATKEKSFGQFFNEFLASELAPGSLAGFNHPSADGHNASRVKITPELRDKVVMSETHNGPVAVNKVGSLAKEARLYDGWIAELDAGWRVAPTCGLDSHGLFRIELEESESRKTCRTGILAPRLTRWQVLNAMWERRMFSTTDANLDVRYTANGEWMGAELGSPGTVEFGITAKDPDVRQASGRISKVDVVGSGGEVLVSKEFSSHDVSWNPLVPAGDNSYMFVRVFTSERDQPTALAAPVWLD